MKSAQVIPYEQALLGAEPDLTPNEDHDLVSSISLPIENEAPSEVNLNRSESKSYRNHILFFVIFLASGAVLFNAFETFKQAYIPASESQKTNAKLTELESHLSAVKTDDLTTISNSISSLNSELLQTRSTINDIQLFYGAIQTRFTDLDQLVTKHSAELQNLASELKEIKSAQNSAVQKQNSEIEKLKANRNFTPKNNAHGKAKDSSQFSHALPNAPATPPFSILTIESWDGETVALIRTNQKNQWVRAGEQMEGWLFQTLDAQTLTANVVNSNGQLQRLTILR